MADLHILQKNQNVTVLFLREEFNFTVIVEKILLQTATKIDANAKSREFKKWDFYIAPLVPQIFFILNCISWDFHGEH